MKFCKSFTVLAICFLVLTWADDRNVEQKAADAVKNDAQAAADTVTNMRHGAAETYQNAKEHVKEGVEPIRQDVAHHAHEVKEGAKEIKQESARNMSQVGDKFSEGGSKLKEGAVETLGAVKDTAVVGAKTVGHHVGNVATGVAGVASDAASAVAGAAIAAKDAVGKTIIGAGEAITSNQALAERSGVETTIEPLRTKRDVDGIESAMEGPKLQHKVKIASSSSSEEHQVVRPRVIERTGENVMLARPVRYA